MSSSLLAAELPPVDACPSLDCHPGDNPACLPLVSVSSDGGIIAGYCCGTCGMAWATRFDRFGWPVDRSLAPALGDTAGRAA